MSKINFKAGLNLIPTAIFALIFGLSFWFFGSDGAWVKLVSATTITKTWLFMNGLKYVLNVGFVTGWLWLLHTRRELSFGATIRIWLTVWLGGMLTLFVAVVLNDQLWSQDFYNMVFLMTRNTWPLLTGTILGSLMQPYVRRWPHDGRFWLALVPLLSLPLLAGQDVFGFGAGLSLTAVLVYWLIASDAEETPRLTWRALLWTGIGLLGVLLFAWINTTRSGSLAQATRWLSVLSPLTVVPAAWLAQQLTRLQHKWHLPEPSVSLRLSLLVMLLAMSPGKFVGFTKALLTELFHADQVTGRSWYLPATFVAWLGVLLIAIVAVLIAKMTRVWRNTVNDDRPLDVALTQIATAPKQFLSYLWQQYQRPLMAGAILFATQVASSLLMNQDFKTVENLVNVNNNIFSSTIMTNFPQMLAGTLVLAMAYWVLLGLTNRYWFSLLLVSLSTLTFAVANLLKLADRNEPILPSDLAELKSLPALINMVGTGMFVAMIVVVVVLIGGLIYLDHRSQSAKQPWWQRLLKIAVGAAMIVSLGFLHHTGSMGANVLRTLGVEVNATSLKLYAQSNGPVLQFASQLDVTTMAKPAGYSEATMKKLIKKYQKRAKTINRTRDNQLKDLTVVFNLSESFSDPANIPGLKLNKDPIPTIRALKKETTAGSMLSFGYGGGTANMEYMTLTGMSLGNFDTTLRIPYTQLVTKQKVAPTIGSYFDYDSAIHPYRGGFYNRPAVYKKFDFNKFAYLGSKYTIYDQKRMGQSPYLSDATAYDNALHQINARKGGQFMNLISIQNHMPFDKDLYPDHDYTVSGTGFDASKKASIEHYTQGLAYTDAAVKQFKHEIDQIKKPIIWVFYGDHLAALFNTPNQVDLHATDYFVYANKYAREHGAVKKLTKKTTYVSPNDFPALAAAQGGAKVDPIMALLSDVQTKLPVQWDKVDNAQDDPTVGTRFITQTGQEETYDKLSRSQKRVFHDYQLLQYDITAGKQYALKLDKK